MGKRTKAVRYRQAKKATRKKGGRNWLYLILTVIVVVVLGLGATLVFSGGPSKAPSPPPTQPSSLPFPSWIRNTSAPVQEAYAYAAEHPDTTKYIACYCGCGAHSGHKSIHDCFVASRGSEGGVTAYDLHGKDCDMCVDSVLITKKMMAQGKSLKEARQAVDAKYSKLGPSTDTPFPP